MNFQEELEGDVDSGANGFDAKTIASMLPRTSRPDVGGCHPGHGLPAL